MLLLEAGKPQRRAKPQRAIRLGYERRDDIGGQGASIPPKHRVIAHRGPRRGTLPALKAVLHPRHAAIGAKEPDSTAPRSLHPCTGTGLTLRIPERIRGVKDIDRLAEEARGSGIVDDVP